MQQNNYPNQTPIQQTPTPPPPPSKPNYKFRWAIFLGVPLVLLFFIWLGKNVKLSFTFDGITELLQIEHTNNLTRFLALMILGLAFIVIVKLFKKRSGP